MRKVCEFESRRQRADAREFVIVNTQHLQVRRQPRNLGNLVLVQRQHFQAQRKIPFSNRLEFVVGKVQVGERGVHRRNEPQNVVAQIDAVKPRGKVGPSRQAQMRHVEMGRFVPKSRLNLVCGLADRHEVKGVFVESRHWVRRVCGSVVLWFCGSVVLLHQFFVTPCHLLCREGIRSFPVRLNQ